jgi:general transcription factor 3C polypeptide 3 (transcription factor C subunit 4)
VCNEKLQVFYYKDQINKSSRKALGPDMAPRPRRLPGDEADSDDDDQSIYPDAGTSYPYFNTADPALAAAYAYGHPSGGQYPDPIALYGGSTAPRSPSRIRYGHKDLQEDEFDDEQLRVIEQDPGLAAAISDANDPRIDPDYESTVNAGVQELRSDEDSEDIEPRPKGRGKGRSRARGGRAGGTRRSAGTIQTPRIARGRGRRGGRTRGGFSDGRRGGVLGKKHGPRAMAEPTAEFKNYNSLMNKAYIAENFDEALKYGLEAVKVNPEMFHVHATIAEILLRKGRREDALGALYIGVHATRDEGSWWYVIEKLIELGMDSKDTKQRLQDCYSSLLDMDPENYKARFGRMKNYIASGQKTRARNECLNLIHRNPFDTEALQVLAEICFSSEEPTTATPAFAKFFEHSVVEDSPNDTELAWKLLDLFMELLVHSSEWEEALFRLRTLARWILGRSKEVYWDIYDDDREWDLDDEPRRANVEEYQPGRYPIETYGEGLPIELRQKIGLVRLGMGSQYHAEALVSCRPQTLQWH